MKKTERLVPEGNNKMLMIRNRYDRDGNIITPDDYGKREPPEGFMDFLIEVYIPIAKEKEQHGKI